MQPDPILQSGLRHAPWRLPQGHRLPGTAPCPPDSWLLQDEAHAAQMALRDRLLSEIPDRVTGALPGTGAALDELLDLVLDWLGGATGPAFLRADGVRVPLDRTRPLLTLGRLVQEDLCLLQPGRQGEHALTAAVLCFPANWTLSEKLGRPLTGVHAPVVRYDATAARRVQRLFDALRPGVVLERGNCLRYDDFALYAPHPEAQRRPPASAVAPFLRLERQTLRRLPQCGAVVFAIHTTMVRRADLTAEDREGLSRHLLEAG